MTPSILPLFTDPSSASPDERTRAVAEILAAGLLRLRPPLCPPETTRILASENSLESTANELDVLRNTSVTVSAVNTAETQRFPGDQR